MQIKYTEYTVQDLIDLTILERPLDGNHGETHPKGDDFISNGIPFIMSSDIKNSIIDFKNCKFISEYQAKNLRKGFSLTGDVLLTHKASIGRTAIVPDIPTEYIMLTPQVTYYRIKDFDKLNNYYLKYYFDSKSFQDVLAAYSGAGSTRAYIGITEQLNLPIRLPDIKNQRKIASVLSALDSKIELNNRINAELEAMAKTLYDYWFVQFEFHDKNGKPYKTSGGKMVWSEELKREIPEGFFKCKLGDVMASTGTGLNPRENFVLGEGNNYYVTIKNIEQGRVILDNKCDKITDTSLEIINKRSDLKIGDILFTSIEPVGITYLILEKPKNWNINESVFTIRPNYEKVTSEFLFMFLSGDYIKSYTKNVSAGSIHKGVRHSLLKDCKFMLPERNTVDAFTMKIQPILNKLDLIQKENQKLTELRDWLLPMLMNGQVKVN